MTSVDPNEFEQIQDGPRKMFRCLLCPENAPIKPSKVSRHQKSIHHSDRIPRQPSATTAQTSLLSSALPPNAQSFDFSANPEDQPYIGYNTSAAAADIVSSLHFGDPEPLSGFAKELRDSLQQAASDGAETGTLDFGEDSETAALSGFLRSLPSAVQDESYYPFSSRAMFLINCLMNLPRHPISRAKIQLILEFAQAMGAPDVPSYGAYLKEVERLKGISGTSSQAEVRTDDGNVFYANSIATSLFRDFAHPIVRSKMSLYSREGCGMSEIRDGTFTAEKLPAECQPPMISVAGKRCFRQEPSRLRSDDRLFYPEVWIELPQGLSFRGFALVPDEHGSYHLSQEEETGLVSDIDVDSVNDETRRLICFDSSGARLSCINPYRARFAQEDEDVYIVPVIAQIDDLSGNASKRWNVHYSASIQNGLLEQSFLTSEASIRFFAISQHADPIEIIQELVSQVNRGWTESIKVYDVQTGRQARVLPYLLFIIGDTSMQAVLASSIGKNGLFPCRYCTFGGETKWKATVEGLEAVMQPGPPRTNDFVRQAIDRQLDLASQGKDTKKLRTQTGVVDAYADELAEVLALGTDTPGETPAAFRARMEAVGQTHNPLLDLSHFDLSCQLPNGILHTVPLGVIKHSLQALYAHIKTKGASAESTILGKIQVLLESCETAGIYDGARIPGGYYIRHRNSLNGKDFKVWAQVGAAVIGKLVQDKDIDESFLRLFLAAGRILQLAAARSIPEKDRGSYLSDIRLSVLDYCSAAARAHPKLLTSRLKLHHLQHLWQDIRLFGPSAVFSEERFESFNTVLRNLSIHSNRQAASKDIARKRDEHEHLRHIVTGGLFYNVTSKRMEQASTAVLNAARLHLVSQLAGSMSEEQRNVVHRHKRTVPADNGHLSRLFESIRMPNAPTPAQLSGWGCVLYASVTTQCGAKVKLDGFVALSAEAIYPGRIRRDIARILEILEISGNDVPPHLQGIQVVVQIYGFDGTSDIYFQPRYRPVGRSLIISQSSLEHLLNVQHDCSRFDCQISGTASTQIQEGVATAIKTPGYVHKERWSCVILNTNFVRDSQALRHLYVTTRPQGGYIGQIEDGYISRIAEEAFNELERLKIIASEKKKKQKQRKGKASKKDTASGDNQAADAGDAQSDNGSDINEDDE